MNTNTPKQQHRRTINLDDITDDKLVFMAWQAHMNVSEFVRWLITEEAKRREAQPAAEAH